MGFFSSIGKVFSSVAKPVASVVGGVLGLSGTKDTNETQEGLTREQIAYQKELAQNQMQWRVEDAKKAGLHPMAALGLSPSSYSPVSTSLSTPDYNFLSEFGQDVDRAIMQGKTAPERKKALELQETQASLAIKNQELQNDLLETELADKRFRLQQQMFPPTPSLSRQSNVAIDGQPDGRYFDSPILSDGFRLDSRGRRVDFIPSEDLKSRTEDVFGVEWMPFINSAKKNFRAKVLGEPVDGFWWHGDDKGFLPYPPKRNGNARKDSQDFYYLNSRRYR